MNTIKLTTEEIADYGKWLMGDIEDVPTEAHANRIIATIICGLAQRQIKVEAAVTEAIVTSRDGNPKAQLRLVKRIRQAGALDVVIETAKRGKYKLCILELVGWNPATDEVLGPKTAMPEKPWLAVQLTCITDRGRDAKRAVVCILTHHCVSRCAQRAGLGTAQNILRVANLLAQEIVHTINLRELKNGHRLRIGKSSVAVLVKHKTYPKIPVVATILDDE